MLNFATQKPPPEWWNGRHEGLKIPWPLRLCGFESRFGHIMKFEYTPQGVCSRSMQIEVVDGVVRDLQVIGGCNGNLQGIGALVKGMKVEDVIARLKGIRCGFKATSCPDQLATALENMPRE